MVFPFELGSRRAGDLVARLDYRDEWSEAVKSAALSALP